MHSPEFVNLLMFYDHLEKRPAGLMWGFSGHLHLALDLRERY